ncbi:MAG: efflux RND transporter periplasmic adaptor subunit [Nitrospirota bacterium]|nr:efflux RND transporter periplasmic adaptor subunit [Nitrospirota bacterium]MDH5699602.1 efflux RND transporter periplasmic adaptor subunit [Nitrospirota bacterium]
MTGLPKSQLWWVFALAIGVSGWQGCSEQEAAQPPKGRPPSPVKVVTVSSKQVQRSVSLVGTAEPRKRSLVASEVAGLVKAFAGKEGQFVNKGQLLASLRTDTLGIRLDSAVASHREAKTRYEQAQKDLDRVKVLFAKELVTQKEQDDAVAQESALEKRLSQLEAEIRLVQDQLTKSTIMAPFPGWITKEYTEIGQWVEEGGPVVELVDLAQVEVQVPLPEEYVRDVRVGDPVVAVFDALPGVEVKGTVFSVIAQADRSARTFPVKVVLANPDLHIKSGMVARVHLAVGAPYQAVVIPKDALVLKGGKEFAFIVANNTVTQVTVTPVAHFEEFVEVQGAIEEGMQVVVEGNERLLPGQSVRILEEPAEA